MQAKGHPDLAKLEVRKELIQIIMESTKYDFATRVSGVNMLYHTLGINFHNAGLPYPKCNNANENRVWGAYPNLFA